jgi:hypothetical protein
MGKANHKRREIVEITEECRNLRSKKVKSIEESRNISAAR